jgi:site-specific DNA-methyltransferase (adenine-specific)
VGPECHPAPKPYYQDEAVTIYHGDCRSLLPGLRWDVTITDPPYDEQVHSRGGSVVRYDGGPDIAKLPFAPLENPSAIAALIAAGCTRWALVFCAVRQIERWALGFEGSSWNVPRVMAWVKPDASPQFSGDRPGHGFESIILAHPVGKTRWNGGGHKGVFTHNRMDYDSGSLHPTQKPLKLMRQLVQLFSDEGETILDPFMGSGTTLRAAKDLGRKAIGIEIEERWCEVAANRMAQAALPLDVPPAPDQRQAALFPEELP